MANLTAISGKLVFKLDSGEEKNGKPVYFNVIIGGIDGARPAASLAEAAKAIAGVIALPAEQVTLLRAENLIY